MIANDCIITTIYVYLNINNKKQNIMTTFEKLENWALRTKDIEALRNAFIEVITNNRINVEDVYNDHKKSVDITNAKTETLNL